MPTAATLYENAEKTVTLVDIPRSIVLAQGTTESLERTLLSSAPLDHPFAMVNEPPKSAEDGANTVEASYHSQLRDLISRALEEVRRKHMTDWCLPRVLAPRPEPQWSKKRKVNDIELAQKPEKIARRIRSATSDIPGVPCDEATARPANSMSTPYLLTGQYGELNEKSGLYKTLFQNTTNQASQLRTGSSSNSSEDSCYIPAHSLFLQSRIEDSVQTFKFAASSLLNCSTPTAGPGQFDFMLLDPPWPNASAKRAKSYQIARTLRDTEQLLELMRLEEHIAPSGFVGIWITNKPKIREFLLRKQDVASPGILAEQIDCTQCNHRSSDGLFAQWGIQLIEEWIWVKTTRKGEPVTDLESNWRKPYEIMLLGQRKAAPEVWHHGNSDEPIKRRVIIAVPDLHSRKPSVKELIETLMSDSNQYRAVEIFARNLTAGWWAWGDEVLKFNWNSCWATGGDGSSPKHRAEKLC